MKSTSITPTLSQNTVTNTFPADCLDLNFFKHGEVGWHHSIDALFDFGGSGEPKSHLQSLFASKRFGHYGNTPEVQNKLLGGIVYEPL